MSALTWAAVVLFLVGLPILAAFALAAVVFWILIWILTAIGWLFNRRGPRPNWLTPHGKQVPW
jgi:hypothetical protein